MKQNQMWFPGPKAALHESWGHGIWGVSQTESMVVILHHRPGGEKWCQIMIIVFGEKLFGKLSMLSGVPELGLKEVSGVTLFDRIHGFVSWGHRDYKAMTIG